MSNVNIKRAIENIKIGTTVYSPIVEMIVNAIEAIEEKNEKKGEINIAIIRSNQLPLDEGLADVVSFEITDNGIGFTKENREAFDTLFTDQKVKKGGKGFGRFICLKYFEDLSVDSVYKDGDIYKRRTFIMGKMNEIIVDENITISETEKTGTTMGLLFVKEGKFPEKKLHTIAMHLVEKILPYFISKEYICPKIIIKEKNGNEKIVLNNFVHNELASDIKELNVSKNTFILKGLDSDFDFFVRVFKLYSPKHQKSKISLVAHNREVTDKAIHNYIPEFIDEFYESYTEGKEEKTKNYIIRAYVFGKYLDDNVLFERGGFLFQKENDLIMHISQNDIERAASDIAKRAVGGEIKTRLEKKKSHVKKYVEEEAPWHQEIFETIDLSEMPLNPSKEEIEIKLQKEKFKQEIAISRDVKKLLTESSIEELQENVSEIVRKISGTSKNDLAHYIASRKSVLDIFERSLNYIQDGKYVHEGVVHDIIFPRKKNSETISFKNHNLWIIDERLNFTEYISSDLPLKKNIDKPDLLVFNKRVLFRGDNEPSNPVTIFEFKRPQRDDFANLSSKEDPIQQIIRYVNSIKDGDCKTPEGRKIQITENTPFYGYVICDLTKKIEKWLETEKDFKPMPDRMGWFQWFQNINLYVEVLSWEKLLKDANMRNKIFFHKLNL